MQPQLTQSSKVPSRDIAQEINVCTRIADGLTFSDVARKLGWTTGRVIDTFNEFLRRANCHYRWGRYPEVANILSKPCRVIRESHYELLAQAIANYQREQEIGRDAWSRPPAVLDSPTRSGARPSPVIQWTDTQDSLLGKMTDKDLAIKLGVTLSLVQRRRTRLGIAAYKKHTAKHAKLVVPAHAQSQKALPKTVSTLPTAFMRLEDVRAARAKELACAPQHSPYQWNKWADSLLVAAR